MEAILVLLMTLATTTALASEKESYWINTETKKTGVDVTIEDGTDPSCTFLNSNTPKALDINGLASVRSSFRYLICEEKETADYAYTTSWIGFEKKKGRIKNSGKLSYTLRVVSYTRSGLQPWTEENHEKYAKAASFLFGKCEEKRLSTLQNQVPLSETKCAGQTLDTNLPYRIIVE